MLMKYWSWLNPCGATAMVSRSRLQPHGTDWSQYLQSGVSEQGLTCPPTQYRLSGRQFYRSKEPTNSIKVLKEQNATKTKHNPEKANNKIQQNKTSLMRSPHTTLGQETRWAYSTTLRSPHGASQE